MNVGPGPDEYFRAIEEEFVRRRGAPLLLSPRDWALIGSWQEAGIPLWIVLQGIASVFDAFERRSTGGRRINSLAYCRQEVLALHDLYRSLRGAAAGRPGAGPPPDPVRAVGRHLGRLQRALREAMAAASAAGRDPLVAALAQAGADLRSLRRAIKQGTIDPQGIEEELRIRDERILAAARAALPAEELTAAEREADRTLASQRARMAPDALGRTRSALVARFLRQACRLPRLTLFE